MFRKTTAFLVAALLFAFHQNCNAAEKLPASGFWEGYFLRSDGIEIPFYLQIKASETSEKSFHLALYNKEEIIEAVQIVQAEDSFFVSLAYFDTELRFHLSSTTELNGYWRDNSRDGMQLALKARHTEAIPHLTEPFSGQWQVTFRPGQPNFYPAILKIEEGGPLLKATFRSQSGDYRFLHGYKKENQLKLYRFDGQVIYLFIADVKGDSLINAKLYSGPTAVSEWLGWRDEAATLSDPYERTNVISSAPVDFYVKNLNGDSIRLHHETFRDKVTLLTIMGTWCPNCLDESRFLQAYLANNPDLPIQVFGLSFERPVEWAHIKKILDKYTQNMQLPFEIFYGGKADAESVGKLFPMLDRIKAWPTMIILDKQGNIAKIHTGFDGPATGETHLKYAEEFDRLMRLLSQQ